MSRRIEESLEKIAESLGWCTVWLFILMLATCAKSYPDRLKVEIVEPRTPASLSLPERGAPLPFTERVSQ